MRRKVSLFASLLLYALPAAGEVCQITRRPLALWPPGEPLPPRGVFSWQPEMRYAGGKYFVNAAVYLETPQDGRVGKDVLLVSDDLQSFRRVAGAGGEETFLSTVKYVKFFHGVYFGYTTGLVASLDGEHWSLPVAPWFDEYWWDGNQFVGQSFLFGIGTSTDGFHWEYRGEIPATSIHTSAISDGKRFVTFAAVRGVSSDKPMVTEDFENWTFGEPPHPEGWFPRLFAVGNGYYLAGHEEWAPLTRSRDGLHYEEVAGPERSLPPPYDRFTHLVLGRSRLSGTKLWELESFYRVEEEPYTRYEFFVPFSFDLAKDTWQVRQPIYEIKTFPLFDSKGRYALRLDEGAWDGRQVHFVAVRDYHGVDHRGFPISDVELLSFACPEFGEPQVFPGVAHGEGALGTFWKSSLSLTYAGQQEAEVLLEWLPYGRPNPSPRGRRVWLNTGQTVEWQDVVAELFGATGHGALRLTIVSGSGVVAVVRTYNQGASGSYGQLVPGWSWEEGVGPGEDGWLVGLADSGGAGGFRTNVGVQNLWVGEVEVEVRFFGADGQELGKLSKVLGPFEGYQWFRPLRQLVPSGVEKVSAVVRIVRGNDSRVACYASKVDNVTGDGTTIKGIKLPYQGRPFENPCPQGCPPLER